MRILFISHFFYPHVGGVEKHVLLLSRELIKNKHQVTVLTERHDSKLKLSEKIEGIKIVRFDYPKQKFVGLIYIWNFIWLNRKLIEKNEVIHVHDVFIWYLPFRFLFINKKIFTTIHGLEWGNPLSISGILQKRLAVKLSNKAIGIGKFIEKYAHVKFDLISYGAVQLKKINMEKKNASRIVFVGRLSTDTGILQFLKWLNGKKFRVDFVGDGELRSKCEKYGNVHGFTDPQKFLRVCEYCVPGGYLACLEAFASKCKVKVFWQSDLKKDYWRLSPFYKFILSGGVDESFQWAKSQSWKKLMNEYVGIWNLQ